MRVPVRATFTLSRRTLGDSLSLSDGAPDVNRTIMRFEGGGRAGNVRESCADVIDLTSVHCCFNFVCLTVGVVFEAATEEYKREVGFLMVAVLSLAGTPLSACRGLISAVILFNWLASSSILVDKADSGVSDLKVESVRIESTSTRAWCTAFNEMVQVVALEVFGNGMLYIICRSDMHLSA
jgi:hypothetical protein